MKFPQLPVGSHFRWQGERYCKTGTLTAHAADGTHKLIPRSARVEPLDTAADHRSPANTGSGIPAADVGVALDALTGALRGFAKTLEGPQRSALAQRIDLAERDFRRTLRLPDQG